MKHEEIEAMMFIRNPETGTVVAIERFAKEGEMKTCDSVFGANAILNKKFESLLVASPYIYHQLTFAALIASDMLATFDALPFSDARLEALKKAAQSIINGSLFAQQVAQVGYERMAEELIKDKTK